MTIEKLLMVPLLKLEITITVLLKMAVTMKKVAALEFKKQQALYLKSMIMETNISLGNLFKTLLMLDLNSKVGMQQTIALKDRNGSI